MAVVVATMRKLVHIVYGVLKNGTLFAPACESKNYALTKNMPLTAITVSILNLHRVLFGPRD